MTAIRRQHLSPGPRGRIARNVFNHQDPLETAGGTGQFPHHGGIKSSGYRCLARGQSIQNIDHAFLQVRFLDFDKQTRGWVITEKFHQLIQKQHRLAAQHPGFGRQPTPGVVAECPRQSGQPPQELIMENGHFAIFGGPDVTFDKVHAQGNGGGKRPQGILRGQVCPSPVGNDLRLA